MASGRVLIAGGGIGGLTAALSLAKAGFEVALFERSAEFGEIGAGIQLSPNCTRVLHHLGLESALRACAFRPEGGEFRAWKSGKVIASSALGQAVRDRYGFPYYNIHRGDLLRVLVEAAERSSAIELNAASEVTGFEQDGHVRVMAGGTSGTKDGAVREGDALIGADGIHSTVRAQLFGDDAPRFTGNVAWRALVPAEQLPAGLVRPMATAWWGPHKHFVHYYLRSGTLVNCVCIVEKTGWEVESWTERGEFDELKSDFAGWHEDIQALIDNMDRSSLYKWALHDRPPLPLWGKGAVTLLGDACHPTLPFMAQGAAMAIEDAAVLAGCLATNDDVATGLKRYEDLRRQRTARVQNGSRRNAKLFHLTGVKAWLRNQGAKRAGGRAMHNLFSYDALQAAKAKKGA
ncbi:MAG: FAD-dependent monooxygenase [Gammaproteobacteria bacterium]|nr:FAD-dependent monooxygenase [Gammaproteobacteria bacterium]